MALARQPRGDDNDGMSGGVESVCDVARPECTDRRIRREVVGDQDNLHAAPLYAKGLRLR